MDFSVVVALVSILAGGIASVVGFGIGSILTPLFSVRHDIKLAVAAVSIPHLIATSVRFWRLQAHVDRRVLKSFGFMSAAGGLTGAVLQRYASSPGLTVVFAILLAFVGLSGLTGLTERMRFGRRAAWIAGALSGLLGGLVGNQGGIRSAGLLGFDVSPAAFVATATAIALVVDAARMTIYMVTEGPRLLDLAGPIGIASVGAVIGTLAGEPVLRRIPKPMFRRLVSVLVLALSAYMVWRG